MKSHCATTLLLIAVSVCLLSAMLAEARPWYENKDCEAENLWYSGIYFCTDEHGIGVANDVRTSCNCSNKCIIS